MSQVAGWVLAVDRPFKVVFTLSFTFRLHGTRLSASMNRSHLMQSLRPDPMKCQLHGPCAARLPKGSCVVLFGVCYGFWAGDYNILPKKELHRRVWVASLNNLDRSQQVHVGIARCALFFPSFICHKPGRRGTNLRTFLSVKNYYARAPF